MRLKIMEQDYERTIAADKGNDNLRLKGTFEQSELNNVKFENNENNENNRLLFTDYNVFTFRVKLHSPNYAKWCFCYYPS